MPPMSRGQKNWLAKIRRGLLFAVSFTAESAEGAESNQIKCEESHAKKS
jgi:hypothetical protein